MTALILHGNAWGFITSRDGYGYPTGIDWIPPHMVEVMDDPQQPWNPLRTRVYVYGRQIENWRTELFHIRAFTLPGRTEGISPLRAFAMTVLSGMEAQRYGVDWFSAGGFPPGTFQNNEIEIDQTAAAEIRESLTTSIRNRQPLVYGRDWKYEPVVVPPAEAQFIETMQMNATMLAAIYGLPPDRVGGKRGDSLTYNCVTTDTEILTTRGWLAYDQVREGDTALTLNHETGVAEWQPVTSVHIFEDGPYPVIEFTNSSHSSASTPDHRWPVITQGGRRWQHTGSLTSDARVTMAAPVAAPAQPKWSDALTELVAWFWTEGWHNEYGSVVLTQSDAVNPQNVARIRNALTEVFGPAGELQVRSVPSWREDRDKRGHVHFRLNARAGRQLLEHAPGKVVSAEFLSQLTRAQLELFYQTSIDADGTRRPDGKGEVIAQRDRARVEAFQVAAALTGRAGVIRENVAGMHVLCLRTKPYAKPRNHSAGMAGTAPAVWCVQTPNKSWFARRNGTCYFTGNTVEQSTLQVIEALRPWLVRLETAFFDILPANRYVRFNPDAMLKTDLKTRTDIYNVQRNMGMLTIDEIRDKEDMEPYPDSAGDEKIPLEVMVAMSRSIRAIPNSMLKGITLEVDLITDRLEKLEAQGLTTPDTGTGIVNPDQFLGQQIGSVRSDAEIDAATRRVVGLLKSGGLDGIDTDDLLAMALERKRQREQEAGPQFIGPWIPTDEDLARLSAAGGNGNGKHH
jgi:hypothetical protein